LPKKVIADVPVVLETTPFNATGPGVIDPFVVIAPGFVATPVTVNVVELGTDATALFEKL
jgi:hypothetical protein